MRVVEEGKELSKIEYEGEGELRLYFNRDLPQDEIDEIEDKLRDILVNGVKYDARVLSIKFKGIIPELSISGVEGWQIVKEDGISQLWSIVACATIIAVMRRK